MSPEAAFTAAYGGPAPRPPVRTDYARHCDYLAACEGYLMTGYVDHTIPKSAFLNRTLHKQTEGAG